MATISLLKVCHWSLNFVHSFLSNAKYFQWRMDVINNNLIYLMKYDLREI